MKCDLCEYGVMTLHVDSVAGTDKVMTLHITGVINFVVGIYFLLKNKQEATWILLT